MAARKEKQPGWMAVPQFGGWDQKAEGGGQPDYSMVFSRARANRKQHKSDITHANSLGNEKELIIPAYQRPEQEKKRNKLLRYFSCCTVPTL